MQSYCINFILHLPRNMKYFANILAFYMMALFVLPCDDLYVQEGFHTAFSHQDSFPQDPQDDKSTNDFCSPFCMCNCCNAVSGFVFSKNIFDFKNQQQFDLPKVKTLYKNIYLPNFIGDIWQPPKLTV